MPASLDFSSAFKGADTGSMAQNNIDIGGAFDKAPTQSSSGGFGLGGVMSGVGAGMSASAAYGSAKNQQAALEAQAQVALNNATLAEWGAEDATQRGEEAAGRVLNKGAQIKGAQRAGMAANGIALEGDSAQRILNDTDYLSAIDATTVQNNAAREAWGMRMQGRNYVDAARSAKAGAKQISPWLAAGTSLLTNATSVAGKWYQMNNATRGY